MAPLRLRGHTFDVTPDRPLIMGVVNVSPESFSDGSDVTTVEDSVARGLALLGDGAQLLDVGGESGVTNRPPIAADEEIRRVVPVVAELVACGAIVSVDTWKRPVAQAVLAEGAHLINDVSGLGDPGIAEDCAAAGAGLVLMHTRRAQAQSVPPVPQCRGRRRGAPGGANGGGAVARMDRDQLVIDPGPDFAKTPAQTLEVLRNLERLQLFGRPVLLALSRKDFIGALTARMPRQRLAGTLAAMAEGLDRGGSILRVHDVAETAEYLRVRTALRGDLPIPADLYLPEELRREPPFDVAAHQLPARQPSGHFAFTQNGVSTNGVVASTPTSGPPKTCPQLWCADGAA